MPKMKGTVSVQPDGRHTGSQLPHDAAGAMMGDIQRTGWSTSSGPQLARLEGRWLGS